MVGIALLTAFLQGLADNIEPIGLAVAKIIVGLINALIVNRNMIVQAGLDALFALLDGLGSNADAIVTAALGFILQLIAGFLKHVGELVDGGIELLTQFLNDLADSLENAQGLVSAIDRVAEAVVGLIIETMLELVNAGELLQIGKDLVGGIKAGVDAAWSTFVGWIEGLYNMLPEALRRYQRTPTSMTEDAPPPDKLAAASPEANRTSGVAWLASPCR